MSGGRPEEMIENTGRIEFWRTTAYSYKQSALFDYGRHSAGNLLNFYYLPNEIIKAVIFAIFTILLLLFSTFRYSKLSTKAAIAVRSYNQTKQGDEVVG
jgi:hypothetical protein